jgi:protein-tyrosine phosphatase
MDKTKILFVCTGNICRSPGAEAIFSALVEKDGLEWKFKIDSAGTSAYHVGEKADKRMQEHAKKRGYYLNSISRKFESENDFDKFDMIIAMDDENINALKKRIRSDKDLKKLYKLTDFRKEWSYSEIPDPFYGGDDGFELVLDLIEDSCIGLLEKIRN